MGESGGVKDLERFKQSFGATPQPLLDFRIERFPFSRMETALDLTQRKTLERLGRFSSSPSAEAG
jgi:hypothetical protein